MATNNQTDTKTLNIKRTICIGLGGTGRDILMQIRRLIVDRYGKLSELPVVSFVHIDTDKGASQVTGLKTGDSYHGENILFKPSETLTATMNNQEINDLAKGLERRSQYERSSPYDHIGSWFPPQILKDLKSIENGAGAIRPVGRLAFFHNYDKIQNSIRNADNSTIGHSQKLLSKNIVVDPGTNIIIIGSLCGGTGSGIFIDTAYSLREMYGYEISNEITAYLVIAPELYGNTASVKANTYAALKELNYYTAQGTTFTANYDPVNLFSVSENRPPFDFVYLVGNRTNSGHKIVKKDKLSQVIAHKIFADFAEEIAINIKGHRDNVKKYFSLFDEHPRPNSQRYLTFGLAKIYFPRDLTIAICLNKLKLKLLTFWLYGEGQSPDSGELLDKFLLNWRTKNEGNNNIFQTKLEAITQENDKTFKQSIKTWQNKLLGEIENTKTTEDRQRFIDKMKGELKNQFKKVQPGETENIRGLWLTQLQKNSVKLQKQFSQDIIEYLAILLEPSNPNFALDNSRGWLEAILTKMNEYVNELEEEKQKTQGFITLENIEKKWQDFSQRFDDIETEKKGFFGMGKHNKTKINEFREEATQSCQDITKLINRNFDLILLDETLKIVTNLRQLVQQLKTQASNFYNLLQSLESFYQRKGEDLSQIDDDEINGEAVFEANDNDQFYQVLLPEQERRNLLVEVSHKINETATIDHSLLYFFTGDRLIDEKELASTIDQNIEAKFGDKSVDLTDSVVNRFVQKYPFSDGQTRLKQILDEAEVLLPLNTSDRYFINDADKTKQMIGFKLTDDRENKQFRDLITQGIGINSDVIIPLQTKNEIIVIKEYAGFPLRIVNGLKELREQYERQKRLYDGYVLHNEYSTFFLDIIPPDTRGMEILQDTFYTCLAFGKITKYANKNKYYLELEDRLRNSTYQSEISGVWEEALEEISQNENIKEYLEETVINMEEELKQQPDLFQEIYYPNLINFVNEIEKLTEYDINFTQKKIVLGERTSRDKLGNDGILGRIYDRFIKIVNESQQSSVLQENQPQLSSKNSQGKQRLLTSRNNSNNGNNTKIKNSNDDVLEVDIWDNYSTQVTEEFDQEFRKQWEGVNMQKVFDLHDKNIISDETLKKIIKFNGG